VSVVAPALAAVAVALAVDAALARLSSLPPRRPDLPTRCPAPHRRRPTWRSPWRRAAEAGPAEVAAWCDGLARRLRAGDTLAGALAATATPPPIDDVVARIVHRCERGTSLSGAIDEQSDRLDAAAPLGLALAVIGEAARLGGPAAPAVERVAATLRLRVADAHERRAQTAQARLSASIMSGLPVAALALSATVSAPVRGVLGTVPGVAVLAAGGALNLLGWWWMRHIVGASR
jgi:tight adherence protein B